MTENHPISFGDNVKVRETPITQAAGIAGLVGNVYGFTTPSMTKVEVIGELKEDFAFNVFFEERDEAFWLAPDLLEFVDHAAGTEIIIDGSDKKWVRNESGEWEAIRLSERPNGIIGRIIRFFKKK